MIAVLYSGCERVKLIRRMSKKAKRKILPMQIYRGLKNGTFEVGGVWGQPRSHSKFPRFFVVRQDGLKTAGSINLPESI